MLSYEEKDRKERIPEARISEAHIKTANHEGQISTRDGEDWPVGASVEAFPQTPGVQSTPGPSVASR